MSFIAGCISYMASHIGSYGRLYCVILPAVWHMAGYMRAHTAGSIAYGRLYEPSYCRQYSIWPAVRALILPAVWLIAGYMSSYSRPCGLRPAVTIS